MSGSTIGGVVGGVIGFWVGGPQGAQWGWMIGSMVGGAIDPEVYEGPRLNEATTQTAQDGVPLIYGYGRFPCKGNLIWTGDVVEHRNEESSKGGPVQVSYTYTVSYAICVCSGPISGYLIVKRNGKIVFDARTDAELSALGYTSQEISETRAAQAEFLQRATFYYGTYDQMPDPTMVAALGADQVPAYSGVAYIVLKDDETREGEVAQYEFVVAACGERTEDTGTIAKLLVTGSSAMEDGPLFAIADAGPTLLFSGIERSTGADVDNAVPAAAEGVFHAIGPSGGVYTIDQGDSWVETSSPFGRTPTSLEGGLGGWAMIDSLFTDANTPAVSPILVPPAYTGGDLGATGSRYFVKHVAGAWWTDNPGTLYRSPSLADDPWVPAGASYQYDIYAYADIEQHGGSLYAIVHLGFDRYADQIRRSDDGGDTWPHVILTLPNAPEYLALRPRFLKSNGQHLIAVTQESQYVWTSADGFDEPHVTGLASLLSSPRGRTLCGDLERFYILGRNPDTLSQGWVVSTEDGISYTEPVNTGITSARGMALLEGSPPGTTPIPDAPGYYIDNDTGQIIGPPGTQIDPCQPTLGEIVADQCERRGVVSRDVSELTDVVLGYRIAAPSTPQRNIQGLQPGYFFGASEFDGVLHFAKRGRALTFNLTMDDFVERDGDPIQWERTQERELARKVTVAYVDPETSYAATTQQAERRAATIAAEGETTIELAVTGEKDWAAQVADKSIKAAWGEPDECTFHVSIAHADLVTGAEGMVPYTDGEPTVVRIERIEDEGLVRMVTARKTRANLYESNASGAAKPLPRFPGSNIRGPTDGLLMNIPILIDQDDRPGIYWAASRMLSGWQGTQLQILRAGQWVTVGDTTVSAAVGALLEPLPAHTGDIDTAHVLRVRMNEELESVTFTNLLQERNPLAILRPDGTAEIIQFQTATETAPDEFELTMLLRNRLDTGTSDHAEGARVVFLDNRVQYASLEATDLGQTLEYRFVSNGTNPDDAPIQTITLTTMESQREWPVDSLEVEQDGDDFILTWLRRDRLGTDVLPIRSANWTGYEVSYSYPGGSDSVVVNTETHTFTLPGASDITFSVAQLNQYTGAGPAQTVHIP